MRRRKGDVVSVFTYELSLSCFSCVVVLESDVLSCHAVSRGAIRCVNINFVL